MTLLDEPPTTAPAAPPAAPELTVLRDEMTLPQGEPQQRPLGAKTLSDQLSLVGSLLGSLALVWLLYDRVLPFSGPVGFFVCWFVAFIGFYTAVTRTVEPGPAVRDRLASGLVHGGAGLVGLALASVVIFTFAKGYHCLFHLSFWYQDASKVGPTTPLGHGGVGMAIVGSLEEIGMAIAVAVPLGVGTAIYMVEIGGKYARIVRTIVEAMTALPSIVAGLFIYSSLLLLFHFPKSGFAAACAIFVMILPIMARASDVVLRVVPGGLREASLALGASRWQTVWRVVLPTARPGLATALILAVARGVGETSPVLLTSGANNFYNFDPFHSPMHSLPLYILQNARSGQPLLIERAYGAACVLLLLVLVLFVVARLAARRRTV